MTILRLMATSANWYTLEKRREKPAIKARYSARISLKLVVYS